MKIEVGKRKALRRFNSTSRDFDKAVYSRTPIGLRELFAAANEVPLALLGLVAYCFGGLTLLAYFRSVGYMPDDIAALPGLAVVVTGLSLLTLIAITALFLMPTIILRSQGLQLSHRNTLLTFLAATSLFCAIFLFPNDDLLLVVFGIISAGALLAVRVTADKNQNATKTFTGIVFAAIATAFVFLSALLVTWMSTSHGTSDWKDLLVFTFTLIIFSVVNAALVNKVDSNWEEWKGWIVVIPTIVLCFLNLAPAGIFPSWAATYLGIRLDGIVELVIPEDTCKTIQSRIAKTPEHSLLSAAKINCENFGNQAKAEVKVRLGRSWLVCVRELNGVAINKPFSMTIPSAGTELIVKSKAEIVLANGNAAAKDDSCDFARRAKSV